VRQCTGGAWVPARAAGAFRRALSDDPKPVLTWTSDAARFADNRINVAKAVSEILPVVKRLRSGETDARSLFRGVRIPNELDEHQVVNLVAMTLAGSPGLCLFDEQGIGKTVTLIFAYDLLVGLDEIDFLLVVAPKSMVTEWQREFERFMGDAYRVVVGAGPRDIKRTALATEADILVTHFETVVSMEAELTALMRRYGDRGMLAVDESFFVKNPDAARTRSMRRVREWCGRTFVLCGTPAPNSPDDLVEQFNLVDFGVTFDGVEISQNSDEARAMVQVAVDQRGLYTRHLKREVLPELPPRQLQRLVVPLAPRQRHLYLGALDTLIEDLGTTDDKTFQLRRTSFLARRSALLQICSNPASLVPEYTETPAKLAILDHLLDDLITVRHEKVVLWSFYRASIDAIVQRYSGRFDSVRYDGSVFAVDDRREAVRRFQEDDVTMLFVGNPAAAGAGLTLHRARVAIYESMSNQAAHYMQSLDRIHRRGQRRDVEYILLLCDQTIELREFDRLNAKQAAAADLFGDELSQPVTRTVMLSEAVELRDMLARRSLFP
jgi:SNF2 family DNA or RNA helicase